MASITLSLPDDQAAQIRAHEKELPRVLESGMREIHASGESGFDGAAEILELLVCSAVTRGGSHSATIGTACRAGYRAGREEPRRGIGRARPGRLGVVRVPRTPGSHGESSGLAEANASRGRCLILNRPCARLCDRLVARGAWPLLKSGSLFDPLGDVRGALRTARCRNGGVERVWMSRGAATQNESSGEAQRAEDAGRIVIVSPRPK